MVEIESVEGHAFAKVQPVTVSEAPAVDIVSVETTPPAPWKSQAAENDCVTGFRARS